MPKGDSVENDLAQQLFAHLDRRHIMAMGAVAVALALSLLLRPYFIIDEVEGRGASHFRQVDLLIIIINLVVIALVLYFVLRPAARSVQDAFTKLSIKEDLAIKKTVEIETLYKEKEKSLQELRAINFAVDQAALFASATNDGKVIYLSQKFRDLLGVESKNYIRDLSELMSTNAGEQQFIRELIKVSRSQIWNEEVPITTKDGRKLWLEISVVPVNRSGVQQDLLILCSNITSRKEAQIEVERLSQDRFKKEVQEQKERSAQIVEAQEEERKRIARDIHDGIGQMLTSLKFNLESVDPEKPKKAIEKIEKLKGLASELIKGVRMATFNLTPPELIDHGVAPALKKLADQLSKLTSTKILFENRTGFNGRFDSMIETNLYRITQEAVNNAVKYAESEHVLIRMSHNDDLLSIVIDDDGIGFDHKAIDTNPERSKGSGMGLAFMKDRIHFVNGRIFIHSVIDSGTRITINMPLGRTDEELE